MKTMGFPISRKENENRRAIIPEDLKNIRNVGAMFFEEGYGHILGFSDSDYKNVGANISARNIVLKQDLICDPKIGDADYLKNLTNQTIVGWIHAVQNRRITDLIIENELSAYAWEDMYKFGRHIFYKNNELAGEAAVLHAFQCYGVLPFGKKVALLGRGNVAIGAMRVLNMLGAEVSQYGRAQEELFRKEFSKYDVIINAILWDPTRTDHIIYKSDLSYIKPNSLIIDISCDKSGAIETSVPTTIDTPTYICKDIVHYVVDHTPSLYYRTASENISKAWAPFIDQMIDEKISDKCLVNAEIIHNGTIIDKRICVVQQR